MGILKKDLRHFASTLTWNSAEIRIQDPSFIHTNSYNFSYNYVSVF